MNNNATKEFSKSYNVYQGGWHYINAIIWPIITWLGAFIFFNMVALILDVEYDALTSIPVIRELSQSALYIGLIVAYVVYSKKVKIKILPASYIKKEVKPIKVIVAIALSFVCIFLIGPIIGLFNHLLMLIGYAPDQNIAIQLTTVYDLISALIVLAIMPAIIEELVFRGGILNGLQSKLSPKTAILISALMFTLFHGALQQTIYQFILGIVFALMVYYSKNIIYPIIMHFFNNAIVIVAQYIYNNADMQLINPVFETFMDYFLPITMFVMAVIIIILSMLVFKFNSWQEFKSYLKDRKLKKQAKSVENSNTIEVDNESEHQANGQSQISYAKIRDLKTREKLVLAAGFAISIAIWIVNTLAVWLS